MAFDIDPKDDSGDVFDMTDRAVETEIFNRYDELVLPPVIEFTTNITGNSIELSLTAAETALLEHSCSWGFAVWVSNADPERLCIARGGLSVTAP